MIESMAGGMQDLSTDARRAIEDMGRRHDVSTDTLLTLLAALRRGGGTQAQFNIPELGGMGQWSRGGMTMVGDMFNQSLKSRVDRLCTDLSGLIADGTLSDPAPGHEAGGGGSDDEPRSPQGGRWPAALGNPSASGSQNDMHYAVFPDTRRLAIERDGRVTVYDTGDHRFAGFSQQQGGDQTLSFTSQHGLVRLADLPMVDGDEQKHDAQPASDAAKTNDRKPAAEAPSQSAPAPSPPAPSGARDDAFGKLEQLADLHRKGVLNDDEFNTKKAELLSRI